MVGMSVGAIEGFIDGRARGCVDGTALGDTDRRALGAIVGNLVGGKERSTLGDNEGEDGWKEFGEVEGEKERLALEGCHVGTNVERIVEGW